MRSFVFPPTHPGTCAPPAPPAHLSVPTVPLPSLPSARSVRHGVSRKQKLWAAFRENICTPTTPQADTVHGSSSYGDNNVEHTSFFNIIVILLIVLRRVNNSR